MTGNLVVFAIDNGHDLHTMAKFLRHVDTKRALMELSYFKQAIGFFEGKYEHSFIMLEKDFEEFVKPLGFVKGQKSFLCIPDVGECSLKYQDGVEVIIGSLFIMGLKHAASNGNWTYLPEDDIYWVVI